MQECNVAIRQDIAQIAAAVHGATVRLPLKSSVFLGMVANVAQRYTAAINANLTRLPFGNLVARLIQNPDLRT